MNTLLAQANKQIMLGDTQPKGQGIAPATLIEVVVNNVITILVVVGALGILFMFVWGAVEWIFSGGDKEKVAGARKRITNALIGMVLLSLGFVILFTIGKLLHFDIFGKLPIPSLGDSTNTNP